MKLIDRDKLIADIVNTPTKSDFSKPMMDELCDRQFEIIDIVKSQPVIGQWIPCDEQLPPCNGTYLITDEVGIVETRRFIRGMWENVYEIDTRVVAWAELPTPYEANND